MSRTSSLRPSKKTGRERPRKARAPHLSLVGRPDHARARSTPPVGDENKQRKADHVARDLLRKITSRELAVGSLLAKEDELASAYGVNRGVVREAVKLLEVHRLVRPVRRRGTVVLEPLHSMSPEVLVTMVVPHPGQVNRKSLESFLEVRAILDVEMTALATQKHSAADIRALRACTARLADLVDDGPAFAIEQRNIPLLMARTTKNPMFEMMAAFNLRVVAELEASLVATRPPSREQVEGLSILIDVVERGDVELARRMVEAFHAWVTPRILASAAMASGAPLSQILSEVK